MPAPVDTVRISALLHPFLERTLPEVQLQQISTYIDLLLRWNAHINLTAIRNPDEIVTRHFGESLFMARHLLPETSVERAPSPAWPNDPTHSSVSERPSPRTSLPEVGGRGQGMLDHASPESSAGTVRTTVFDIGSGPGFP